MSIRAIMLATLGVTVWVTPYAPPVHPSWWSVPLLLCSLVLGWATLYGTELRARVALFATVVVGAAWFGGFVAEAIVSGTWLVSSLVAWGGLVAIDLVMLRRPLTTPFEELLDVED